MYAIIEGTLLGRPSGGLAGTKDISGRLGIDGLYPRLAGISFCAWDSFSLSPMLRWAPRHHVYWRVCMKSGSLSSARQPAKHCASCKVRIRALMTGKG